MKYLTFIILSISIMNAQEKSETTQLKDYYNETVVSNSASKVYEAIAENVDQWWLTTTEKKTKMGETFRMDFETTYKVFEIVELVPNKKVVWECVDAYIDIKSIDKKDEWIGSYLIWDLEEQGSGKTLMKFTHKGLQPNLECYDVCSRTWGYFLNDSLKSFIETGVGKPY